MKDKKRAYKRLAQILQERAQLKAEGEPKPELLEERFMRSVDFESSETTAAIEDRIRVLEAAIETRLQLEVDKRSKGLLPSYYSPEDRKMKDERDREEINRLKSILLYRENLAVARELDRAKKKDG